MRTPPERIRAHSVLGAPDQAARRRPNGTFVSNEKLLRLSDQPKEPDMLKKIVTLAFVASGLALAACNTIEGAGKDVESVGEAAQDAAK